MDDNLTAGTLALIEERSGYGHKKGGGHGMAATGIGLAAGLGGGALLLAIAGIWGVNQASKARSRSAEQLHSANAKTIEMLTNFVTQGSSRQDGINVDVTQTLRSLTGATAQGGTATSSALATAEALALLNNSNNSNGINSAIGGCNFLRVARYSAPQPCGCDTCNG